VKAAPELSVIVLSYRNEAVVLEAVDSLLGQGEPVEVVVSHSGGGRTPQLLRARPQVQVVSTEARRLPGAARNAGLARASGPYVAFLAADCVAAPGWVAGRLARHRAGALALANPLAPQQDGICPRAVWLTNHCNRLPVDQPADGGLYGVSYAREVLERYGPFPEDRLIGEDSCMNDRLEAAGIEIEWASEVLTLHRYSTSFFGALAESYHRGTRLGQDGQGQVPLRRQVRSILRSPAIGARLALAPPNPPVSSAQVRATRPMMVACATAKAFGAVVSRA
jgi:GT2 family glycosyltransferase